MKILACALALIPSIALAESTGGMGGTGKTLNISIANIITADAVEVGNIGEMAVVAIAAHDFKTFKAKTESSGNTVVISTDDSSTEFNVEGASEKTFDLVDAEGARVLIIQQQ